MARVKSFEPKPVAPADDPSGKKVSPRRGRTDGPPPAPASSSPRRPARPRRRAPCKRSSTAIRRTVVGIAWIESGDVQTAGTGASETARPPCGPPGSRRPRCRRPSPRRSPSFTTTLRVRPLRCIRKANYLRPVNPAKRFHRRLTSSPNRRRNDWPPRGPGKRRRDLSAFRGMLGRSGVIRSCPDAPDRFGDRASHSTTRSSIRLDFMGSRARCGSRRRMQEGYPGAKRAGGRS